MAAAGVSAPAAAVFAFLSDLENHWLLTGPMVRVVSLRGPAGARDGGVVRVGPPGLGRLARTEVIEAHAPGWMAGRATIGRSTRAVVRWTIRPRPDGSEVALEAWVERIGPLDRLILALGGRVLLRRLFVRTLAALGRRFESG